MIQVRKNDGRARRATITKEITYQKVLLSVFILSDGVVCSSSNEQIARNSGHGVESVRRTIAEMERRGVVQVFDQRISMSVRAIVLLDHPEGPHLAHRLLSDYSFRRNFGVAQ